MGQALYRKYRSKSLKEIIGQDHITSTLNQAIKSGRISHAYLLTGPRGVGKTSVARILAHEINNLPYTDDSSHIDIIEIDAASNRRIDEIRELREKVYVAPTSAKYKVYIIDEVQPRLPPAFRASCCGCCRRAKSAGSARARRSRSMSAPWPPPTGTSSAK